MAALKRIQGFQVGVRKDSLIWFGQMRMSTFKPSIESIKKIRKMTSAGYVDCKKALLKTEGDFEKAIEWLKEQGILKARSKLGRHTSEGGLGLNVNHERGIGVILEINSETDFAARSDRFKNLCRFAASNSVDSFLGNSNLLGDIEKATLATQEGKGGFYSISKDQIGPELQEKLLETSAALGENVQWRRGSAVAIPKGKGILGSYTHPQQEGSLIRAASLVCLLVGNPSHIQAPLLPPLANDLALQLVGEGADYIDISHVPPELKSNKEFKTRDNVLLEQRLISNPTVTIKQRLIDAESSLGSSISIHSFVRFFCGEGIVKQSSNFGEDIQDILEKSSS